jgi:2-polyprenyl-3-methyl-5-hydroxy-6-metoxy-1,4-benzoquinol methylase
MPESDRAVDASAAGGNTTYDKKYRAGGFGYEEQRDQHLDFSRKYYVEAFDLKAGSTLVDVGCGDGFWCGVFRDLGFSAAGIDLSVGGIEVAREKYPDCEFEAASAEEPLFGGERQFDVVFSRAISHFCVRDLLTAKTLRVMEHMAGAVAPGGTLLVSFYSRRNKANENACADHLISDMVRLVEVHFDPWRIDRVGNYIQIAAHPQDAARG